MELLICVVVILSIIIIFLLLCLINMKRNIKSIDDDLKFINLTDTNSLVKSSTVDKNIQNLVKTINENIVSLKDLRKTLKKEENKLVSTITNLSHDLRTPLTSILGYTQLIMKENLTSKQAEYINIINERIKHLRSLVDELYEYSLSYDEKEIVLDNVNIKPLLEETLLLFYKDFTDKSCEVSIEIKEEKIMKTTDVGMLKRVFYNIISNALKYGKDSFKIEYINNEFIFSNPVINTDVIDVEKLFDRFFTVAKSRTSGSSGLGLSIVKKIIEDLGGEIKATLVNDILSIFISLK